MTPLNFLRVGHRGARAWEPENTLRSFAAAIRQGVDMVEFDVRFTRDGAPVVIHDQTLERTTNGKGPVAAWTVRDLKKLDAGRGERIPTLAEALQYLRRRGVEALVELKEHGGVERIVREIKSNAGRATVISFYTDVLKKIARLNPRLPTGLIFSKPVENLDGFLRLAKACKTAWLLGQLKAVNRSFIERAHRWGFQVEVWVANDPATVKRYAALGADAIASDTPDVFTTAGGPRIRRQGRASA